MATVVERMPRQAGRVMPVVERSGSCAPFNVSTREPEAIAYWCRHFNTTPERLLRAVRRVGSNPDIIRLELRAG